MEKHYHYAPIFLQKVAWVVFSILYYPFLRLEIIGKENLKNLRGPIILAPNHTGEMDVTVVPLIFPFFSNFYPIYFLTNQREKYKQSKFGWRGYIYGGLFFDVLGGSPVYSGYRDYATALENHISLLREGHTISLFPEGKITLDGHIGSARGGLGYLVHTTEATVVPIAINSFYHMTFRDFITRKRKIVVTVCKPMTKNEIITVENPTVEDFRAASKKVLDRIDLVIQSPLVKEAKAVNFA